MDQLCFVLLCFHASMFVDAVWSPAGETPDLLALVCDVQLSCCHFPIGTLRQVWSLIVSIPDLCPLTYYDHEIHFVPQSPLQSNPRHRKEDPLNTNSHKISGRQLK